MVGLPGHFNRAAKRVSFLALRGFRSMQLASDDDQPAAAPRQPRLTGAHQCLDVNSTRPAGRPALPWQGVHRVARPACCRAFTARPCAHVPPRLTPRACWRCAQAPSVMPASSPRRPRARASSGCARPHPLQRRLASGSHRTCGPGSCWMMCRAARRWVGTWVEWGGWGG